MLSPKRVVLIENFKILEGTKTKNIGENEEKELIKYLSSLPDSCLLILTSPRVDKRKKIFKTISQEGTAYDFCRLEPKQLRAWISKKFKEAGKKASSEVIGELVAFSGYYDKESDYTLYHMDNDLKKIIAYSDGPEILWNNINNNLSGNINTFIFDMIDAVSKGKKEEAFQLLHNLLLYGENEYKILALICSQFEAILSVKELQEEGQNEREIKNILGIHIFLFSRQSRGWVCIYRFLLQLQEWSVRATRRPLFRLDLVYTFSFFFHLSPLVSVNSTESAYFFAFSTFDA